MRLKTAVYRGHARYSFHGDEEAEVRGLRYVRTEKAWVACLVLRYPNGDEDYAPLEEALEKGYLLPKDFSAEDID